MAVTVVTLSPSLVRGTTAKFNGELTDMNGQAAIDCYFQYKITGAGSWSDTSANKEELTAVGEFSYEISGLTENESYDVRAVAEWTDGTLQNAYGSTIEFDAAWIREGSKEDFERGILSGVQLITHQVLAVFKTTGSHSWTVPAGIEEVDVLVVAGGGGGGGASDSSYQGAGGGGAGGLRFLESHSVTPAASITVVVGAGGTGGTSRSHNGANGGVSSFDGQEAAGGGGGARRNLTTNYNGLAGGCGGGASRVGTGGAGNTPSTTPAQGRDGFNQLSGYGGGGGGHGEGGPTPGQAAGGDGSYFGNYFGDRFGEDGWFAGGGAGGGPDGYLGGKGGGGKGGVTTANGDSGLANTGGGGGGADQGSGSPTGSGGSGIVIIAVPLDNVSLDGEGTRQKPYKISDKPTSEITWTATTPTDTTLAIEAQVKGTTAITDEAVGTGDGTTKVFTLDHWPADTPTVKVNAVTETGFTLGDDRRTITFDTAPADTHAVTASYTAVDDSQDDDPEIQTLDLDNPTGGTFKLGDGTSWTADIAHDASAADIETALEGLYGAGNVEVLKDFIFDEVGTTSWTVPAGVNAVDVLVVAGGGAGGGTHYGGGGGGGGVVLATNVSVVPGTSKTVTIGDGGAGVSNNQGGSGGNSVFDSFAALGGGGGGHWDGIAGVNGGSGGGGGGTGASGEGSGGSATQTSPTGATGYGNNGGNGVVQRGGGGGGAGAVGSKGDGPGDGGAGIEIWGTYYAGGGGGGTYTQTPGSGGTGGGGAGTTRAANSPSAGTPNTGGGGGGASNATATGAAGGSGIVIIALPKFVITFALSVGNSGLTADFTGLT